MLSKELSNAVLTIGCSYDPPRGGVAQVLHTYSKEVYPVFRCVTNSGAGGKLKKLWLFVKGWLKTCYILLFSQEIKIVHIHTASYNSFKRSSYFVRIAKIMGRKVVLHIHGGGFKEYYATDPQWIKGILECSDCVIALTDSWKTYYETVIGLSHVAKVNNIIETPQIRPISKDRKLHLLFLGAINNQKGIFDLAEVINEHKHEWNGNLVLHVGGNQEVDRLLNYIRENKLNDIILYEGWVENEKKKQLLNQTDVFILPSYVEGLPISILEALSYGKPVITTPVGGIPEIVTDENGFLFNQGDRFEMSSIISRILKEPYILKKKSIYALASVHNNLPDSVADSLADIYQKLLKI